ncbi:hypothetical protein Adi01nite_37890 [Amorphoplanes digitatis]|nr:hypothetical protein Adi01nite_37890 [Actinoplanes digitatis]
MGLAAAAIVAGVTTWALWPDPPRQREYLDTTACLLTDDKGVAGNEAKSIWSAMQDSSGANLVRVQNVRVNGPQTARNASAYLASLTGGRCGAIIAVGPAQVEAVTKAAGAHPGLRFVTVGGTPATNVEVIDAAAPDALRTVIKERIEELADAAS